MAALFPLFVVLGLFLPGFVFARLLRHSMWPASAFVLSLVVLFHGVFWLGVFGAPITLRAVLVLLLVVSGAGAWLARGRIHPLRSDGSPRWPALDRVLIVSSSLVGVALVTRTALAPLLGYDTRFRWDFLAQKILALGTFRFYPPITATDFRTYFYPDGLPPLVPFANWWIYASIGGHRPALLSVFLAAQFACTLAFTYGAAAAMFSRRAGLLAMAALAGCPLFFNALVIEQETGITALAMAAMLYFIITAKQPDDRPAMVSAGMAAALCALAREYGWIALVSGVIALLWRRQGRNQVLVFAGMAIALAAPWYARNLYLAGNPFYSLRFGPFAVNPVHDGILQSYNSLLGARWWTSDNWADLVFFVLPLAPLQLLVGIPGAWTGLRERGHLLVIGGLWIAMWWQSVGYTSAGYEMSTRVWSPLLVTLSIPAGGLLARFKRSAGLVAAAILVCQVWTVAQGSVAPAKIEDLHLAGWRRYAFQPPPRQPEFLIAEQLAAAMPAGTRLLSDSAVLHAALADKGIDVVPVWSPEVRFLFSSSPEESEQRLGAIGIRTVVYYPRSLNTRYLASNSAFYAVLPQRWHVVADLPDVLSILQPR